MTDHIDAESRPLAVRVEEQPQSLAVFGSDDPAAALDRAVSVANVLKRLIVSQGYAKKIQGDREFVEVAGWQALGGFLDTFAQVEWSRPIERGFESRVVLIRRGSVVGAGEAICTRDERNWAKRDDYAIKSMSQTRAAGKAFRLTFGWLMTIAGYESTPAEEMVTEGNAGRQTSDFPAAAQKLAEAAKPSPAARETPATPGPDDHARGVTALMALCRSRGVSDSQRYALSEKLFGQAHTADLTTEQLRLLYKEVALATNPEEKKR